MSDLTSETVKQALNWSDQAVAMTWDTTEVRDAIVVLQEAAGRWLEGTPIQWCDKHTSLVVGEVCQRAHVLAYRVDANPFEPNQCRIVKRRLCE